MTEEKFILKYKQKWSQLEELNTKAGSAKDLKQQDIRLYTQLFRETSHHLAYAQTAFPNSKITAMLNRLVARSHNKIYVRQNISLKDILNYFRYTFPKLLRQYKSYFWAAFLVFNLGALLSAVLIFANPENIVYFMQEEQLQGINLEPNSPISLSPAISSFIMINNISVCILAFVTGIFAGVGTLYVLFINGATVGALAAYLAVNGEDMLAFCSLIFPHGFIELTAIFISGACGLILGKHLLVPKELKRFDSIIKGSTIASKLLPGVFIMLVIAGIIEGFFTPLSIAPLFKNLFALLTLVCIIVYFCFSAKDSGSPR